MVWVVIAMVPVAYRSMKELVSSLGLALSGEKDDVAPSTITQVRERLGEDSMEWLFRKTGREWG